MEIFRIALSKYANELKASGRENRWNYKGEKVIYTTASRSLACLEMAVHSSGEMLDQEFTILVIYLPDSIAKRIINLKELPHDWNSQARPVSSQKLGSNWIASEASVLLEVPSALVPQERNFILNPYHKDYSEVQIIDREIFRFDKRIKG